MIIEIQGYPGVHSELESVVLNRDKDTQEYNLRLNPLYLFCHFTADKYMESGGSVF